MSSLPNVRKKLVLICAALTVLTSGYAVAAAPLARPPASAGDSTTVTFDIGQHCIGYRYSKQSHCDGDTPMKDCQAAASVGDCGIQLPFNLTKSWCEEVESDQVQKWHVFCQGTAPDPPAVTFDIGEHCIKYRYSEQSHCEGDVPMNDCLAAQTSGDCGIKLPFSLSSAKCQQVETSQVQKWHVFCEGTVPSGPLPQPQCPGNHVLGDPGQDCVSSCTRHCDKYCIGGYCEGNHSTCYSGYQEQCDCGVAHCPCTGPNCGAGEQ